VSFILTFGQSGVATVSIKCLRSDGGGEYFSNEFNEYLKEHGIQRKYSCSYSHNRMELLKGKTGTLQK
jgi:hypothetical protein